MEQPFSSEELTVRHKFDRFCQLVLEGEAIDYFKHMNYRRKHEVMFSDIPEHEMNRLSIMDEYDIEKSWFQVMGYDIAVRDTLLAEALKSLTERKRDVILLSYFMDMSDAEIAREMNLVRSTVHEHRQRSLKLLKKLMEGNKKDE